MDKCQKGYVGRCYATIQRSVVAQPEKLPSLLGFGAVLSEQGKLAEAIEQLETARDLIDDPKQRVALAVGSGSGAFELWGGAAGR